MSCNLIYMEGSAKMLRPVTSRQNYLALRHTSRQQMLVAQVRTGNASAKPRLVQMNYSLAPAEATPLKGCKAVSDTVAMDVDIVRAEGEDEATYRQRLADVPTAVMAHKDTLGLLLLERSATKGYHLVFSRRPELTQEENLRWASTVLGVAFDAGAKDVTRVFYTTTASADDLLFLDDRLFERRLATDIPANKPVTPAKGEVRPEAPANKSSLSGEDLGEAPTAQAIDNNAPAQLSSSPSAIAYLGIPYAQIIDKWWALYNGGHTPVRSNRDVLTFELAVNLRHICGFDRDLMDRVIPCYDGFPEEQKLKCIDSALAEKRTQMPRRLRDVLTELKKENIGSEEVFAAIEEAEQEDDLYYYRRLPKGALPQGIADSIRAAGEKLALPVLAAVCPMVGALATDVRLVVHGKTTALNMHSFIVGDAASCKGDIDPIVEAWMAEQTALNALYYSQESEYRARKRAAKNAKQQPDEPHLPVRFLTMNNTVANLAERLACTDGKHAFSFTPEADTVAQKWRSSMSDFSTMLRQAYDGTRYDREAKSADATTVHIDHLLWNVCLCGTPDALYRVISNYTDGLLSRFIIAHTPDNTFVPLTDRPPLMTDRLRDRIIQVAHLLPFMQGTLELPRLEERSRQWVEKVRREALKDDDRVLARARLRDHTTAMRMTACLILCAVAEQLIRRHGLAGAEQQLKVNPDLTRQLALKAQTPAMLDAYEVLAESLIDNDMLYFRERLENATIDNCSSSTREHRGSNDRIYDRLPSTFNFEQALSARGNGSTRNAVHLMLRNWRRQGLITRLEDNRYQKSE